MDMPTPCPYCGEISDFADFRTCGECDEMGCRECIPQAWGACPSCSDDDPPKKGDS